MKKSIFTTLALIIAAFFTVVQAQTLDEILNKHFKAVGQEKLMEAKSIYIKAKLSQMGMEMPMEMEAKWVKVVVHIYILNLKNNNNNKSLDRFW